MRVSSAGGRRAGPARAERRGRARPPDTHAPTRRTGSSASMQGRVALVAAVEPDLVAEQAGRDADPQPLHPRSASVMISTRAPAAARPTFTGVIAAFPPNAVRHSRRRGLRRLVVGHVDEQIADVRSARSRPSTAAPSSFLKMSRVCAAGSPVAASPSASSPDTNSDVAGADGRTEIRDSSADPRRSPAAPRPTRQTSSRRCRPGSSGSRRPSPAPGDRRRRTHGRRGSSRRSPSGPAERPARSRRAESSGPPPRAAPSRSPGRRASASPRRPDTAVLSLPLRAISPDRNSVSPERMAYEYGLGDAIQDEGWIGRRSDPAGTATAEISTSRAGRQRIDDDGRAGRRRALPRLPVGVVHRRKIRRAPEVHGDDDGVGERRALGAQAFVEAREGAAWSAWRCRRRRQARRSRGRRARWDISHWRVSRILSDQVQSAVTSAGRQFRARGGSAGRTAAACARA